MNLLPQTRQEALQSNNKFYFTGKPCKFGHIAKRLASSKTCYTCDKIRNSQKPKRCRKEYYSKNRDKILKQQIQWRRDNVALINAKSAKRRATKLQATPRWANIKKIREIYKNCPVGYEVDHIVPLNGELVCGLHVENNLQYLTPKENGEKSNKFTVD